MDKEKMGLVLTKEIISIIKKELYFEYQGRYEFEKEHIWDISEHVTPLIVAFIVDFVLKKMDELIHETKENLLEELSFETKSNYN